MIPNIDKLSLALTEVNIPTNTHKIIFNKDRVSGYADGLEAMRQAVYLILSTERYEHPIYSWDYGIELKDLFGQQSTYVIPVLKNRIIEALKQDDRITGVSDFEFEVKGKVISVNFVVTTTLGEINTGLEVTV